MWTFSLFAIAALVGGALCFRANVFFTHKRFGNAIAKGKLSSVTTVETRLESSRKINRWYASSKQDSDYPMLLVANHTLLQSELEYTYRVQDLDMLQKAGYLPFVNRKYSLETTSQKLIENSRFAIQNSDSKEFYLCCSGRNFGAGKTTFGSQLTQYIQMKLDTVETIIHAKITDFSGIESAFRLWEKIIISDEDRLGALGNSINRTMSFEKLLKETAEYLKKKKLYILLQLDEFDVHSVHSNFYIPSKEGIDTFYNFWTTVFKPIMETPRLMLYVCGKSPYIDQIGKGQTYNKSPTQVWNVPLEMLTVEHIVEVLERFEVYQQNKSTITLASALESIVTAPTPGSSTKHTPVLSSVEEVNRKPITTTAVQQIAQHIHTVSGGVPRYVQHSLGALLSWEPIRSLLFSVHEETRNVDMAEIAMLFADNGTCYRAVRDSDSLKLVSSRVLDVLRTDDLPNAQLFDLLSLLALRGRPIRNVKLDDFTRSTIPIVSIPGRMLAAAEMWGFYPMHASTSKQITDITKDPDGGLTFHAPTACLPLLHSLGRKLLDRCLARDPGVVAQEYGKDLSGVKWEHTLVEALVFDKAWCAAVDTEQALLVELCYRHGMKKIDHFSTAVTISDSEYEYMRDSSLYTNLPAICARVKDMSEEKVQQYSDGKDPNRTVPKCSARNIANVIGSPTLAHKYSVFMMGRNSRGGDLMARIGNTVFHLQAKHYKSCYKLDVPLELQKMVENCFFYPAMLRHVLVIAATGCDMRNKVQLWSDRVGEYMDLQKKTDTDRTEAENVLLHKVGEIDMTKLKNLCSVVAQCVTKNITMDFVGLDNEFLDRFVRTAPYGVPLL